MARFLIGLAAGLAAGFVTNLVTASEPWWLVASAVVTCLVWFGRYAVEAIADALDDLT